MAAVQGDDGRRQDLSGTAVTIGRDSINDIVVDDDPKVSRAHAELRQKDCQWVLVDLGSRNGTFVNDRRIFRHPLRDGDRIGVGTSSLTFSAGKDLHATEAAGEITATPDLTERERQILTVVASGLTDKAIAEELGIGVSTVRSHLDRIREKTGLRRRSELTRLAIELRIVS